MKILNKSENIILDVTDEDRIKKLLGYPDKFKMVEEEQPAYFRDDSKKNNKKNDSKNNKPKEDEKVIENQDNIADLDNLEEEQPANEDSKIESEN